MISGLSYQALGLINLYLLRFPITMSLTLFSHSYPVAASDPAFLVLIFLLKRVFEFAK